MERIILGIDPGTTIMGFGLIQVERDTMKLLQLNELQLSKYSNHYLKLSVIFNRTLELIDTYKPDEVAMAAGLSREIPITEYEPKKVKMAITGNGSASKEQVAKMLQQLLNIKELPKHFDATDGLAVAVCHFFNGGKAQKQQSYSGWDAFVKQNQDRIG